MNSEYDTDYLKIQSKYNIKENKEIFGGGQSQQARFNKTYANLRRLNETYDYGKKVEGSNNSFYNQSPQVSPRGGQLSSTRNHIQ